MVEVVGCSGGIKWIKTIIFILASTYKSQQIGGVFRKLSELSGWTLSVAFPVCAGDLGRGPKGAGGKCSVGFGGG